MPVLPPKTKRPRQTDLPPKRKFGQCLTFPSAAPPQQEEAKPLVQDLVAAPPRVHYLEDRRFSHEHNILAVAAIFVFLALGGIAVVFTLRPNEEKDPIYGAVPGALPPRLMAPESPDKIIQKALRCFLSGNSDGAARLLAEIDIDQAGYPPGWELAGMLKESAGDSAGAMELYSRGIAAAPSEWLFYRRGILHRNSGEFDAALEDMDRAVALPPVPPLISNERLLLLIQMGRPAQAVAEIQAAIKDGATNSGGWIFALCGIALQNGDYQKAEKMLATGKPGMDPSEFHQILKNPVLARHQGRKELMPYYFSNIPKK